MSKCNKVRNPCKICLAAVSQKTGLQCQGACGTWVHYACLNYTPGKIKDIKAGIIKVTCPCPDCKTTMPKEFRTDQPYSCNNQQCPANRPPKCDNMMCPINDGGGGITSPCAPPPCPLSKCGIDCKQHSTPHLPNIPRSPVGQPCVPVPSQTYRVSPIASDACFGPNMCPSGCSSISVPDIPGDYGNRPQPRSYTSSRDSQLPDAHMVEQLCNTVGQLTNQINDLMAKMKQAVNEKERGGSAGGKGACPGGRGGSGAAGGRRSPGSGGGGRRSPGSGGGGGCKTGSGNIASQPATKHVCPKPCFCPGNPVIRKDY